MTLLFPEDPDLVIEQVEVSSEITVTVRSQSPTAACPWCGVQSHRVQSRYTRHRTGTTGVDRLYLASDPRERQQPALSVRTTYAWLSWLAQQMHLHQQVIFSAEYLQIDWMAFDRQQNVTWLATRLPSVIIGACVCLLICLFMGDEGIPY